MPLRWQCPQAVATRTYTAKSDVFSFGVTLWEIYAEGALPYAEMTSEAAFRAVTAGHRLPRPSADAPEVIVGLIRDCMGGQVQRRPPMAETNHRLAQHMRSLGAEPLPTATSTGKAPAAQSIAWPSSDVLLVEGDSEESAL